MHKHLWKIWGSISLGLVVVMIILSGLGSVYGLRRNNQKMVELRDAVIAADKEGDVQKIDASLKALAEHVTSHMNTDLRRNSIVSIEGEDPVQLVNKYYRDNRAEISRVAGTQANLKLVGEARNACEIASVPEVERLQCLRQWLTDATDGSFPLAEPLSKLGYTFDFKSDGWSPDLAGISLFMFAFSIVLLFVRFIIGAVISRIIRSKT